MRPRLTVDIAPSARSVTRCGRSYSAPNSPSKTLGSKRIVSATREPVTWTEFRSAAGAGAAIATGAIAIRERVIFSKTSCWTASVHGTSGSSATASRGRTVESLSFTSVQSSPLVCAICARRSIASAPVAVSRRARY